MGLIFILIQIDVFFVDGRESKQQTVITELRKEKGCAIKT